MAVNRRLLIAAGLVVVAAVSAVLFRRAERSAAADPKRTSVVAVAAASDLRFALDEVVEIFKQHHPATAVSMTYGSSGSFYAQLVNRAPFDLFLSADVSYARQLAESGLTSGGPFRYALGRIAVWVPSASPIEVQTFGLKALADPHIRHIAIANPELAPYGRAAETALRSAGIAGVAGPKLVLGENASQALQFVQGASADAAIIALSLARAPMLAGAGRYWIVPAEMHPPIEHGGAIMKWTRQRAAADAFREVLLGPAGQAVLARYGLSVPSPKPLSPIPNP